jgi:PhnB protein
MPDAIPKGYSAVTPFLLPKDGGRLIEFLQRAFGATVAFRMDHPNGHVAHAELRIGDSMIMLGQSLDGRTMQAMLHLYVPDTDAAYKSAIAAGAESVREPADQFYGDRSAGVRDPEGNEWWIATHIEDVSPEEMERRMKAMAAPA